MSFEPVTTLNISRILIFAIALLMLRAAVGFVVAGFPARNEADMQLIFQYSAGYILDAMVMIALFSRFAYVQVHAPYVHAFFVIIIQEFLSAALLFAIGENSTKPPLWLIDWVVLVVSALLGVEFGRRLRDRNTTIANQ